MIKLVLDLLAEADVVKLSLLAEADVVELSLLELAGAEELGPGGLVVAGFWICPSPAKISTYEACWVD